VLGHEARNLGGETLGQSGGHQPGAVHRCTRRHRPPHRGVVGRPDDAPAGEVGLGPGDPAGLGAQLGRPPPGCPAPKQLRRVDVPHVSAEHAPGPGIAEQQPVTDA
jgi:hypothetical protein